MDFKELEEAFLEALYLESRDDLSRLVPLSEISLIWKLERSASQLTAAALSLEDAGLVVFQRSVAEEKSLVRIRGKGIKLVEGRIDAGISHFDVEATELDVRDEGANAEFKALSEEQRQHITSSLKTIEATVRETNQPIEQNERQSIIALLRAGLSLLDAPLVWLPALKETIGKALTYLRDKLLDNATSMVITALLVYLSTSIFS